MVSPGRQVSAAPGRDRLNNPQHLWADLLGDGSPVHTCGVDLADQGRQDLWVAAALSAAEPPPVGQLIKPLINRCWRPQRLSDPFLKRVVVACRWDRRWQVKQVGV